MNPYKPKHRIAALIRLSEYLDAVKDHRNGPIIEHLKSLKQKSLIEDSPSIDVINIANALNMPKDKVAKIIRDIYPQLIETFKEHQVLQVPKPVVAIVMHKDSRRYQDKFESDPKELIFQVQLEIIPRIGEEIWLGCIDPDLKNHHGQVYNVIHNIGPDFHEIIVQVNPSENLYYYWRKMKNETEEMDDFLLRLQQRRIERESSK